MLAKEIKPGTVVNYDGAPVLITGVSVQSPSARGGATLYKFRGRNLLSKQKQDVTLKGTESLDEADFLRRVVKMMYVDQTQMHLMDQESYEQYSLLLEDIEEERKYMTEELEGALALIYNDECIGLQVPQTIELLVTQCDPGVKGDSATKRTKPATLETGLVVQVPEYLTEGERVKIDTRTGEYLSRV